jgi:hypothetical protein
LSEHLDRQAHQNDSIGGAKTMNNVLTLAVILIVGAAAALPTMAATQNGRDAATKHQTARANAQAACIRQANEMMYGGYLIQRRNFLWDCMMERGFR